VRGDFLFFWYWLFAGRAALGFDKSGGITFVGCVMARTASIEFPIPAGIRGFKLPRGVQGRLDSLLDKQDGGTTLSAAERREAEGLVELAEFLSLLKLRAQVPPGEGA